MGKISIYLVFILSFFFTKPTAAVVDPLSVPNNFFGIHILFPDEISDGAKLVNSSGGDWGYVTIPIQATDRNLEKWQAFMDMASELHVIPVLRIATNLEPLGKISWRKPNDYDLVDFANFLNSLSWPTKNRYIILFNEVNRFDEWGGEYPSPILYSQIVDSSNQIFKQRSSDFFIIMGAFDNASVTNKTQYMNEFEFLAQMVSYDPQIFNKIDGFASHSYPNPGFSDKPNTNKRIGVSTYKFEYEFINRYTSSKKLVFITETGWDSNKLGDARVVEYFEAAFEKIWGIDQDKIVAITPFLLRSQGGQFDIFSFFKDGKPTIYYEKIQSIKKAKGSPMIEEFIIERKLPTRNIIDRIYFNNVEDKKLQAEFPDPIKLYFKFLLGI